MADQKPARSTAILIRGLPGSGKTYLAERLAEALGPDKVVMLDPDAIDYDSQEYKQHVKAQEAEGVDPSLHAYRFSRTKAYDGIAEHKIVIWNQPFTNLEIFNKMVGRLRDHAKLHHTKLSILVVEVEVDHARAKARVDARKKQGGHGPSEATFARFIDDYHSFAEHGYNTVSVGGEADVAESVAKVLKALENIK